MTVYYESKTCIRSQLLKGFVTRWLMLFKRLCFLLFFFSASFLHQPQAVKNFMKDAGY